ncbi:TonB-dependent receptor [Acidobacteria bacterium AB60]|nr:TonB-dependent receptor [Acidobacteria bacterium AB60]
MNKMIRTALVLALFACAGLVLVAPARAQAVYGSIFGTVTDKSGAAVPGATITVTDVAKGTVVTVTSNASGDYSVPHLIPDKYDLKVEAKGFKTFQTNGIQVEADSAPRIDPMMDVGGASETVQVNADQQPELKVDKADVATVFDEQQVSSLPVGDQNFTNLQLLVPGAQKLGWSHAASENPQASQQIMVNGQAFAGTAFELDGTDNQDPILGIIVINPTMDAVTETKITTQNFDAELGKAVSAVVTAQTKSGTNNFHGAVYDFRTSNANLARDPFSQKAGSLPPGLKNRFGGTIGGPVIKDKFFFLFNFEGQRQKVGTSTTNTLPTNLLMETALGNTVGPSGIPGADFSEYATQLGAAGIIYDTSGATPTPFPGNVIPRAYLQRPASLPALALFKQLEPYTKGIGLGSAGNLNGLDSNFHGSGTGGLNSNQWTERVDYTLNDHMHAFERFSRFTDTLTGKTEFGAAGGRGFGIGGYAGTSRGANDSLASGMDIALNPNLLTDFRLAYYRYNIVTSKFDQNVQSATQLGIPGLNTGNYYTGGSPGYDIGTLPGGSTQPVFGSDLNVNRCNCPLTEKEDQFQIVNNWTKIWGNHAFKVGVDLRYARNLRVPSDNNRTGILNANADETSNPANKAAAGGNGFATWLLGDVTSFRRYVSTSTNAKEFQKRTFFYGQDTWRATHKLTVNIGLRWELYFPEKVNADRNGALLNLNDGYLHVAGVGGIGRNMNWDINKAQMFAPRLGLTYQLDPKTVVRTGYGRSFDIGIFGSIFGHTVTQNLPVLANQNINNATFNTSAFTLDKGPTAPAPVTVPANGLLPNPGAQVNSRARPNPLRFPEIDAWNLALQRALTPTLALTVAYVANKGTYTLGDSSGNTTNPNEAAINLPASLSVNGQSLHYDSSVPSGTISSNGGTQTYNFLRRYYGASLPACKDANYTTPSGVSPGQCGWTNDITYYSDNLNTNFNALQVTLQQNAWKGLDYVLNYQWASAFSDATGYATWDRKVGYGRDSNVRTQQMTWYGTYDLPFGHGRQYASSVNGVTNAIINGWQLAGTVDWAGGLPFTLNYNEASTNIPGSAPSYPSYAGKGKMKTSLTGFQPKSNGTGQRRYYTKQTSNLLTDPGTGVFKNPGMDNIGNVGRNTYFGPSFFNSDLALAKFVAIHENVGIKFRFDAYNAFNHISPGNPGGNIESDGTITGGAAGYQPRQLEFSLRVQF